jgi:hypothetical protein
MKKIINIRNISLAILISVVSACTNDFDELNTNPNAPTAEQAAPDLLLTNAIESLTDRVHSIALGQEIGAGWVQYMAKVQYTDEDRYQPRVSDINTIWSGLYGTSGQDINKMYIVANANGHDNYKGVALVMNAYIMSVLTDLFGDVPYSEAFKGDPTDGGILSPKYDTQESIYRALIANLDEANTLLDEDGEEIHGDILFEDDIALWKKFANSLRFRLLLRMSAKDEAFVTQEMTEMYNNADYPIFEGGESAALHYLGSAPNNNPINENRKTRDDHRVSKNTVDLLLELGDSRLSVYALPAATGQYVGIPNGLTSAEAAKYNGNGLANTSKLGTYFTEAEAPGMLMSYSELQFILAEAALKGYISADPEEYYYAGIDASYAQYDLSEDLEDYLANPDVEYTSDEALEKILIQKYIAMFDQGLQGWFEWRRTGIPSLTPAASGLNGGKIPVRLTYPLDEATRNPSNLQTAVTRQGADNLNTPVWWNIQP